MGEGNARARLVDGGDSMRDVLILRVENEEYVYEEWELE